MAKLRFGKNKNFPKNKFVKEIIQDIFGEFGGNV